MAHKGINKIALPIDELLEQQRCTGHVVLLGVVLAKWLRLLLLLLSVAYATLV